MGNCAGKGKYIHEPKNLSPSNSLSLKYELGNNLRKTLKKPIVKKNTQNPELFHRIIQ